MLLILRQWNSLATFPLLVYETNSLFPPLKIRHQDKKLAEMKVPILELDPKCSLCFPYALSSGQLTASF